MFLHYPQATAPLTSSTSRGLRSPSSEEHFPLSCKASGQPPQGWESFCNLLVVQQRHPAQVSPRENRHEECRTKSLPPRPPLSGQGATGRDLSVAGVVGLSHLDPTGSFAMDNPVLQLPLGWLGSHRAALSPEAPFSPSPFPLLPPPCLQLAGVKPTSTAFEALPSYPCSLSSSSFQGITTNNHEKKIETLLKSY